MHCGNYFPEARTTLRQALLLVISAGLFYGCVMGSYGAWTEQRLWQMLFSAVKVPLLLLVTFSLSVPSFFVLNTLLGVRADFPHVLRALVHSQAVLTLVLAALAPYTVVWYVSFDGYREAILFNGLMFAVASLATQLFLRRVSRVLIRGHPVHRKLLGTWLVLYAFVAIQMAWVLRPFIGYPGLPAQFLRQEAWDNAYVIVARLLRDVFAGWLGGS
jgi:hypothetical protein